MATSQEENIITTQTIKQLIQEKDEMEREIKELISSLDSSGAGRSGNLVDKDGFPRNDIDINAIRVMRNRLVMLQNDHIQIMKRIESDLHTLHQNSKQNKNVVVKNDDEEDQQVVVVQEQQQSQSQQPQPQPQQQQPFVVVNAVAPDSPASECGLLKGDQIIQFGSITKSQIEKNGLSLLANHVECNLNKRIIVKVIRQDHNNMLELYLTPKPWSGRGYLGCHLLPI